MSTQSARYDLEKNVWLWRSLAILLIVGAAVFRLMYLIFLCPFDLAPDEAHYWDWSRHLDWSYYSKGPLIAYLIRCGCWLAGGWSETLIGSQMVAVRLPAVVCGSLLLASMYILTAQVLRREWPALLLLVVAVTMPLLSAASMIMTIDSPYACCWGWALVFAYQAVFRESRWAWPLLGLVVGVGILAKYTMVLFFPMLILFLLFTPEFRRFLIHPGFLLSIAIGVLCCFPIVWWNIQNDWVAFFHVRGQAGVQKASASVRWIGPLKYFGQQFLILFGFWFVLWVRAAWDRAPWRTGDRGLHYLWWMSVPMFGFFLMFSFLNGGGQPNWPITAYLAGGVLVCAWFLHRVRVAGAMERQSLEWGVVLTSVLAVAVSVYAHRTDLIYPLLDSWAGPPSQNQISKVRRIDPTCRLRGWQELARQVDVEIDRLRQQGIEPVLIGERWNIPGEIGFYCRNHPQVYSIGLAVGDRHSQYDLWRPNPVADPKVFKGRTFLYVGNPVVLKNSGAFKGIVRTRYVRHEEQGHLLALWQITVLEDFQGFPSIHQGRY